MQSMSTHKYNILITRPIEDSLKIKSFLEKYGLKVIAEPFLQKLEKKFDTKKLLNKILIVTSKNALLAVPKGVLESQTVITSGSSTAKMARRIGCKNLFVCGKNSVLSIIEFIKKNIKETEQMVYVSGQRLTCDIPKILKSHNIERIIAYEMIPNNNLRCIDKILRGHIQCITLYSKYTAEFFFNSLENHKLYNSLTKSIAKIDFIVLSDKIKKVIQWSEKIHVINTPDNTTLLQKILELKNAK